MTELKYLASLQQSSLFAVAEAEKIYKQLRSLAPSSMNLDKFEERVIEKAAPLVAKVQDSTEKLLKAADASVDTFVTSADARLGLLKAGAASYLDLVLKAGDFVVEHLSVKGVQAATVRAVESARDSLHEAITQAKDVTDPDAAVKMATDAWDRFAGKTYKKFCILLFFTTASSDSVRTVSCLPGIHHVFLIAFCFIC